MKSFALKTRFGLYAAALAAAGVTAAMLAVRPIIKRLQLEDLKHQLTDEAGEFFRDLKSFAQAPKDSTKPVPDELIPISLRGKYLELLGKNGKVLSIRNLRGQRLSTQQLNEGFAVISLKSTPADGGPGLVMRNALVGTFKDRDYTLYIGSRLGTIEAMQDDLTQAMLWLIPSTGAVVFGFGWLLGRRALKPVSALTSAAERIDINHPDARLPLPLARDEIFRLTEVLNRSFDRLQSSYAAAARFSADASHQLKTPIAVLRAGLDGLRADQSLTPDQRTEVDTLLKQTRRLTTLVEDLLLLAQADAGRLQLQATTVDLAELTRAMLDDLEVLSESRELKLEHDTPGTLEAKGDARRIALILQNLSENAAKYAGDGGTVKIVCGISEGLPSVSVANTGSPIPDESRSRLFQRFHRGNVGENIRGHGLGLNIARTLAAAQGGDVRLIRSDTEWTEFLLLLPHAEENAGQI